MGGFLVWVTTAGVLLATGIRAYFALTQDGIYWPDEIYQSLEPAHRLAFGYGLLAWEFIDGARSWAFPVMVAGVFKVASALGADHPRVYLTATRLLFCLSGGITSVGVYQLARAYRASHGAALGAASLFALSALPIYFGHRAMAETASLPLLAFGLAWGLDEESSTARRTFGACLLGLSVLVRLQNGLFCVGLLSVLAGRRHWQRCFDAALVFAGWALLFGALDKWTWGAWFHSAIRYLQFNLVEGKASGWGTAEPSYYARYLWGTMPVVSACTVLLFLLSARRAAGLACMGAVFLVVHSAVPHKELRFVLPALPVLFASAGIGLSVLGEWLRKGRVELYGAGLLGAVGLHSAFAARSLTFGDLGAYGPTRASVSAWDDSGSINRLLWAAHDRPDLCGLKVEPVHLAWTGGQSYLHRSVPLYSHQGPPRSSGFYNYAIALSGWTAGAETVTRDGPFSLVRLGRAGCVSDSSYSDRLP